MSEGRIAVDESSLDKAMDLAGKLGATYADIRIESSVSEDARAENGEIKSVSKGAGTTVGVRALAGGTWGFQSSDVLDSERLQDDIKLCVDGAVRAAKASRRFEEVKLAEVEPVTDKVFPYVRQDPISLEEKKDLVVESSERMQEVETVVKSVSSLGHTDTTKHLATTEGTRIREDVLHCYGSFLVTARSKGETQTFIRPYGARGGWEHIRVCNPLALGSEVAKLTKRLVTEAKTPKTRHTTVVTKPEFNSLKVHETVGHPSEGDRVLGGESAWAGRAWWKGKKGEKVGSELVTAVSDARPIERHAGCYGTYKYDDEGVPSRRVVHIERGIIKDRLHSRQTAAIYGVEPNGGMRAVGAGVMPIIRMNNTYFEPDPTGPNSLEEAIEDIDEGVIFGRQSIPSIDSLRHKWKINAYYGHEIVKGEVGPLLKNLSLVGNTRDYYSSIYRVGGPKTFKLYQIPNCGKGDPIQVQRVTNGGPLMVGKAYVVGGA